MRLPITLAFVFSAVGLIAGEVPQPSDLQPSPADVKTHNRLAELGGLVCAPVKGPRLVIVNAQTSVELRSIQETATQMERFTRLPNEVRIGKSREAAMGLAEDLLANGEKNVAFVVVLCSEKHTPSLLVAPESHWAIINVLALAADKPDAETLQKRVQREIWRASCMVMGAANSLYDVCVLKPVSSPKDLDKLPETICPEPIGRMQSTLIQAGMQPLRFAPYRKAVQEGWAPAPTNDIQRAIWKELKDGK